MQTGAQDTARAQVAGRFRSLDGIRAAAALAVLLTHSAAASHSAYGLLGDYLSQLNLAVAVFFGLSGFLLYRPFVLAHLEGRSSGSLRRYAIRRLTRLYPAYWIALAVSVYGFGLLRFTSLRNTVLGFGLLQLYGGNVYQGLPQAWTLCVEVTFYAFLPCYALVIRRCARRSVLRTELLGVGALAAIGIATEAHQLWSAHPSGWTIGPANLAPFAAGMLLAVLHARTTVGDGFHWLRRLGRYGVAGVALAMATYALIVQGLDIRVGHAPTNTVVMLRYLLEPVIVLALLTPAVFAASPANLAQRVLSHPVMVYLGVISYGIYLWHFTALSQVHDHWLGLGKAQGSLAVVTALTLAVTILVASCSWHLLEAPISRWAERRTRQQLQSRRPEGPGAPLDPQGPRPRSVETVVPDRGPAPVSSAGGQVPTS